MSYKGDDDGNRHGTDRATQAGHIQKSVGPESTIDRVTYDTHATYISLIYIYVLSAAFLLFVRSKYHLSLFVSLHLGLSRGVFTGQRAASTSSAPEVKHQTGHYPRRVCRRRRAWLGMALCGCLDAVGYQISLQPFQYFEPYNSFYGEFPSFSRHLYGMPSYYIITTTADRVVKRRKGNTSINMLAAKLLVDFVLWYDV